MAARRLVISRPAGVGEAFQIIKFPIGKFRLCNRPYRLNFPVREIFVDSGAKPSGSTPPRSKVLPIWRAIAPGDAR
jgi:hypothetical protein